MRLSRDHASSFLLIMCPRLAVKVRVILFKSLLVCRLAPTESVHKVFFLLLPLIDTEEEDQRINTRNVLREPVFRFYQNIGHLFLFSYNRSAFLVTSHQNKNALCNA